MVIDIIKSVPACDTAEQGEKILAVILPVLKAGEIATLSFAGVFNTTTSFVNVAIIGLMKHFSASYIRSHLRVVQSNKQINDMIKSRLAFEETRPRAA